MGWLARRINEWMDADGEYGECNKLLLTMMITSLIFRFFILLLAHTFFICTSTIFAHFIKICYTFSFKYSVFLNSSAN